MVSNEGNLRECIPSTPALPCRLQAWVTWVSSGRAWAVGEGGLHRETALVTGERHIADMGECPSGPTGSTLRRAGGECLILGTITNRKRNCGLELEISVDTSFHYAQMDTMGILIHREISQIVPDST